MHIYTRTHKYFHCNWVDFCLPVCVCVCVCVYIYIYIYTNIHVQCNPYIRDPDIRDIFSGSKLEPVLQKQNRPKPDSRETQV